MIIIKDKLTKRLADKGLETNEIDLFIKDVLRNTIDSPWQNMEMIKGRLHLLGWGGDYIDYGTIQLIQACYPDDGHTTF